MVSNEKKKKFHANQQQCLFLPPDHLMSDEMNSNKPCPSSIKQANKQKKIACQQPVTFRFFFVFFLLYNV